MGELSLNVSYANREVIFPSEIERAVRTLADVGPIEDDAKDAAYSLLRKGKACAVSSRRT